MDTIFRSTVVSERAPTEPLLPVFPRPSRYHIIQIPVADVSRRSQYAAASQLLDITSHKIIPKSHIKSTISIDLIFTNGPFVV
jgi:hypothetical protein